MAVNWKKVEDYYEALRELWRCEYSGTREERKNAEARVRGASATLSREDLDAALAGRKKGS